MSFHELRQGYQNIQRLSELGVQAVLQERFEEAQTLLTARGVILSRQESLLAGLALSRSQRAELRTLAGSAMEFEERMRGLLLQWIGKSSEELDAIRSFRAFADADAAEPVHGLFDQTC